MRRGEGSRWERNEAAEAAVGVLTNARDGEGAGHERKETRQRARSQRMTRVRTHGTEVGTEAGASTYLLPFPVMLPTSFWGNLFCVFPWQGQ